MLTRMRACVARTIMLWVPGELPSQNAMHSSRAVGRIRATLTVLKKQKRVKDYEFGKWEALD